MTTIYNYIMRKINQFEDYLLQPSQQTQPIQPAHHHTVKPKTPEKSLVWLSMNYDNNCQNNII